jgi:hypothetical protein
MVPTQIRPSNAMVPPQIRQSHANDTREDSLDYMYRNMDETELDGNSNKYFLATM